MSAVASRTGAVRPKVVRSRALRLCSATAIAAFCIIGQPALAGDRRPLDRGGAIALYLENIRNFSGRKVISGDCMSACTLWLGYTNTCVEDDAVLWFHGAADPIRQMRYANPWKSISETANIVLLQHYPYKVRQVVRPWLESPEYKTLSGRELHALGVSRCHEPRAPARRRQSI